jgi:3-oxoacyl-[acyl-carrier-protein] synthase-3
LSERRVAAKGTTAADLCGDAADKLLSAFMGIAGNINALICVTQTPDHFQPCNAAVLHGNLGLPSNCIAFDINLGCSGWVVGLYIASLMLESGGCENVLLVAGDTLSHCVNPRDRAVAPLFGDAGSATLLAKGGCESWYSLHTDGSRHNCIKMPAGAFRQRSSSETRIEHVRADGSVRSAEDLHMDGAEVFNFSIKEEPLAVKEILEYAGRTAEEVDYVVFHQANKYIIGNIARRLGIPMTKVPSATVEKYGNQSSASIPCTICDALGSMASNDGLTLLLSGFGVGLSWASAIFSAMPAFYTSVTTYGGDT